MAQVNSHKAVKETAGFRSTKTSSTKTIQNFRSSIGFIQTRTRQAKRLQRPTVKRTEERVARLSESKANVYSGDCPYRIIP